MKKWLSAFGRTLVAFVLVLLLLVGILLIGEEFGPRSLDGLLAAALGAAARLVPLAALTTVFLSANAFRKKGRLRFVGFLSLFILAWTFLAGGFAFRRFGPAPSMAETPIAQPLVGAIHDRTDGAIYIDRLEGGRAAGILAWRKDSKTAPRLSWDNEARWDSGHQELELQSGRFRAAEAKPSPPLLPWGLGRLLGETLDSRLAAIDGLGFLEAGLALAAIALLAASLAGLAGLSRWPLAGFFLGATFLAGLCALDAFLAGEDVKIFYAGLGERFGVLPPPADLVTAGAEALLGLILAILVLTARRKETA